MLIRWLLALVFVITALAAPVNATCVTDGNEMPSCCCQHEKTTSCTFSNTCCSYEPVSSAILHGQQGGWQPSASNSVVSTYAAPSVAQSITPDFKYQGALHLASNKLYLKKRSLLI
jgi:hypothetical protein